MTIRKNLAVAARRALLVVAPARLRTRYASMDAVVERQFVARSHRVAHRRTRSRIAFDPARRQARSSKAITKEYFGYYDDLPKRDRDRAQARYHEWWITEAAPALRDRASWACATVVHRHQELPGRDSCDLHALRHVESRGASGARPVVVHRNDCHDR